MGASNDRIDRRRTSASSPVGPRGLTLVLCLLAAAGVRAAPDGLASSRDDEQSATQASDGEQAKSTAVATTDDRRKRKHWDYSRFDNGPRRVPRRRGRSLERAERLGIGGLEATRAILRGQIPQALREEVPGARPQQYLWPVVGGRWGRGFGYTRKLRKSLRHNGIDIGAPAGRAVRAAADGLVVYSDNSLRGLGNAVVILHPGGAVTLYAHNGRNTVQPGWRVQRGERIALVGSTGIARGPHLHFELREGGRLRDPGPRMAGYRSSELEGPLVELEPKVSEPEMAEAPEPVDTPRKFKPEATPAPAPPPAPPGPLTLDRASANAWLHAPSGHRDDASLGESFSDLLWPLKGGSLSRPFNQSSHRAVDFRGAADTPVRAAADGQVAYAGPGPDAYGTVVILQHRSGWATVYAGELVPAVTSGERTRRGQWIGMLRATTSNAQPHLHFEWLEGGQRRDPAQLFRALPAR
ncbi:MAG: M23 family metallopeptidase [Myxococcales bacterium]|nr:M23 family metallopeptidase [Myxococcales bacterium]